MKSEVTYDDFAKLDIRVGQITKAEAVPKSKKLVKLEVYFGEEVGHRTILAGIAGSYDATMLQGIMITAIINLAARAMMGETSHGMLLAGHSDNGHVQLVQCLGAAIGCEIG
jgi:methionyl-tRNA synthetase